LTKRIFEKCSEFSNLEVGFAVEVVQCGSFNYPSAI
jgi:hypothetical protein